MRGCMNFLLMDKNIEDTMKGRSFSRRNAEKIMLKLANKKNQPVCTLCANYGNESCFYKEYFINSKFDLFQTNKHKCEFCYRIYPMFHYFLNQVKSPIKSVMSAIKQWKMAFYFNLSRKKYFGIKSKILGVLHPYFSL